MDREIGVAFQQPGQTTCRIADRSRRNRPWAANSTSRDQGISASSSTRSRTSRHGSSKVERLESITAGDVAADQGRCGEGQRRTVATWNRSIKPVVPAVEG